MLSVLTVVLSSCEKVVDVDLKTSESKVVVEGFVVDQPGMSYVKLSMSSAYFDAQHPNMLTNAVVKVNDGTGEISLIQTQPGIYKPDAGFAGEVGRTYNLTVTVDGKTYSAQSTLKSVPVVDSVTYKFFPANNAEGREEGYYAYGSFQEPAGFGNNYRIDLFANNVCKTERPGDIIVFDDKYTDGGYASGWDLPAKFQLGDTITLKMYSLDRPGFDFYTAMYDLAEAGGLFGKSPANVPSNIRGDAFGYFGASSVSEKWVVVK